MKKKILLIPLVLLLAISLVATGCPAPAPVGVEELEKEITELEKEVAAEKAKVAEVEKEMAGMVPAPEVIEWKFSAWASRGMFPTEEIDRVFIDAIEKASGGRLTFKFYGVGELIESDELFPATKTGTLDMVTSCGYHVGELPFNEVEYNLPLGLPNLIEHHILWYELGAYELAQEAYLPHNLHLLPPQIGSDLPIMISKKEIRSIADIVGMKARAYGSHATMLEELGASVVWVPFAELYTALATGVIDGAGNPSISEYTDLKLYEVAKWVVLPPMMPNFNVSVFANLDSWNALPEDLQAIVTQAAMNASTLCNRKYKYLDQKGRGIMEAAGVTFVTLPPEDYAVMREMAPRIWDEMGAKDPTGYGTKFVNLTKEYMEFLGY